MNARAQRGMSMMVALFLIVIVASLAAFATTIGTSQNEQTNLQLTASRALEAARTGNEWAATRALASNVCPASTVLNLVRGALNGFSVTVTCRVTPHTEGAITYNVYDMTSFAQYGRFGSTGYVSKSVVARYTSAP